MFEIVDSWAMCNCVKQPRKMIPAIKDLLEEVVEFYYKPSYDEASDIVFCIGRILGSIINKPYVSIPGDCLAIDKISERMMVYGCIRSSKHLIFGECPSKIRKENA